MPKHLHHIKQDFSFSVFRFSLEVSKDKPVHELHYLESLFMETPYKFSVLELVEASRKIIDELDFDQLTVAQIKRQKELAEFQLKRLDEFKQAEKYSGSKMSIQVSASASAPPRMFQTTRNEDG